jgi:hypothetical protein
LDARLCFTGTGIKYHRGIDRVYAIRVIAMKHGKPVSSPGTLGKQTARNAEEDAGKGKRKKRMPPCNRADRGLNVTPRESGQTSLWSLVTREFVEPLLQKESK